MTYFKKQNLLVPKLSQAQEDGSIPIQVIVKFLKSRVYRGSNVKCDLFEEYLDIVSVIRSSKEVLWPNAINIPTHSVEGRILLRMLFISMVEKFETYLFKLVFQICTENTEILKCDEKVSINEILTFPTMKDFIVYRADLRINELKNKSLSEIVTKDGVIRKLISMTDEQTDNLRFIFHIKTLYLDRNAIVDAEFKRQTKNQVDLHSEFVLTIEELLRKLETLVRIADSIDFKAVELYKIV